MTESSEHTGITRYLSRRLLPLSVGIGLLVAVAAPAIYWTVEHSNFQHYSTLYAEDLAEKLRHFAIEAPTLWKYQTYKFITLTEGFHPTIDVSGFRVLDEKGEPIEGYEYKDGGIRHQGALPFTEELHHTLGVAPIQFNNRQVGTVEVTVSDAYLLRTTSLLFCITASFGASLALLVYGFPVRVVRRMEERLKSATEFSGSVLDSIDDAVSIVDAGDHRILGCNAVFLREVGMPEGDVVGRHCYELTHRRSEPCTPPCDPCPLRETVTTGRHATAEHLHFLGNGEQVHVEVSTSPIFDASGRVARVVHVARDITERKRAETALAEQARDLARSNAELEQFAYVASHDLQEPLRMVSSYMQLLSRRYRGQLDADADEFIAFAVDGATRMQRLINDLLTLSRVGTRRREAAAVASEQVLQEVLANLQEAIEESAAAVTHDPLPAVMADPTQFGQLLQNLLGNALKFRGEEPPRVHVRAEEQGDWWRFEVRDNGIGMAPQHFERIFQIFQRLHSRADYPGTGIGLALCKKIEERHGGRIWVESEPGRGSAFHFTIPAAKGGAL